VDNRIRQVARTVLAALRVRAHRPRFRGVFASYQDAIAAVRPGALAGYDHDAVVPINFELMCKVTLWDYPVLLWLQRLAPEIRCLIDAGGHLATKYRAFRPYLKQFDNVHWVIYDVPAVVRAGREWACAEGNNGISFIDTLSDAPRADVVLASGLLQFLDVPFPDFLRKFQPLPRHLILNKVATVEGPTVVTLENLGPAETPYQMRNRAEFEASLRALGYIIIDEWVIPELAHVIPGYEALGSSVSRGYFATLPS
jgi:putative methyltransferase (TIGR04325 family)